MKRRFCGFFLLLGAIGCEFPTSSASAPSESDISLVEARKGFITRITRPSADPEPVAEPPSEYFWLVRYESPAGELAAYISRPSKRGKYPAIIWVFGGFDNGIGPTAWTTGPPENDQSASAFRRADIVTMYPSFRGGNGNPGQRECLYGEVDDVLAAAEYLSKLDFVDPNRIYLGGHSTGGTLVMLAAACPNKFRAVFSLGPVDDVAGYGPEELPFSFSNRRELELRSPGRFLGAIKTPVFVFEGTKEPGNIRCLQKMSRSTRNEHLHFHGVPGTDHFSVIAPLTKLLAKKVLADNGEKTNIAFTEDELAALTGR
jgi:alpha/beta superfamily hydrolase